MGKDTLGEAVLRKRINIKEWLGHSDIKMTGNLYAHFNMRQKQGIADSFSANFSSALEKTLEKLAEHV